MASYSPSPFHITPLPVSHLDGGFPLDSVALAIGGLAHAEHPEVLRPVHLQRQLLSDTHTHAGSLNRSVPVCLSIGVSFQPL